MSIFVSGSYIARLDNVIYTGFCNAHLDDVQNDSNYTFIESITIGLKNKLIEDQGFETADCVVLYYCEHYEDN